MRRNVVRFVITVGRALLSSVSVFLIVGISSCVYGQKKVPLASQAQSVSEFENMVQKGLPLSHQDSVLIAFGQMKGMFRNLPAIKGMYGKCGSELALEAVAIRHTLNVQLVQAILQSVTAVTDSIKSPSGRFTIYYSKHGTDSATTEFVDSVRHFADEAYELEIVELGYPKPPFSDADSTWHITLTDEGTGGKYGVTTPFGNPFGSSPSGLSKYRSFITMDNDFLATEYPTVGLDAARITVFHEFHHVIQYGCFGVGTGDGNFREMTSVWVEMRSTPLVKDYIQYIPKFFRLLSSERFDKIDDGGYSECIWMQYLEKRFGEDIIKQVWQFYSDKDPDFSDAFDSVLTERGTDFCTEYKRFGTAVYYTGSNFQGNSPFPDARLFNNGVIQRTVILPSAPSTFSALPESLNIFVCGYGTDTSVIVISRSTDRSAIVNDNLVTSKSVLGFEAKYHDHRETFCDTISLPVRVATKIFPQPFITSSSGSSDVLNILASTNSYEPISASLSIYTPGNTLIRHYERAFDQKLQLLAADPFGGSWYVEWDGKDDIGKLVPSGVYYYSLVVDGNWDHGKFVVIRKN